MELLTDDVIAELADMAIAQSEQDLKENTRIPELTERQKEINKSIQNIMKVIEKGVASDTLVTRLTELEKEAKTIDILLKNEERYIVRLDRWQIVYWLEQFKGGNIDNPDFQRHIIDLLINSVTVWDDPDGFRITTAYNLTSCKNKTFRVNKDSGFGSVSEFGFEGSESTIHEKSELISDWKCVRIFCFYQGYYILKFMPRGHQNPAISLTIPYKIRIVTNIVMKPHSPDPPASPDEPVELSSPVAMLYRA